MHMKRNLVTLGSVLVLCACSKEPEPQTAYGAQGQYGYGAPPQGYPGAAQPGAAPGQYAPGQYAPGQYAPAPGAAAPAPAPTAAPGAIPPLTLPGMTPPAQSSGAASPVAPEAAMVATPALAALSAQETKGMKPEGGAFAAQFQEGQTHEQPIQIQPGKCYAVVGVGVGITELDLQLVAQPAPMLPPNVLAQDSSAGPQATLGGQGNCWKNPLPFGGPAKVIVKATRGSGIGVAQVFVK